MKSAQILLVVLLSAAVAFGTATYTKNETSLPTQKETAFQRVTRTNTLRCGYYIYPQFMERDPNTGAFSGIVFDLVSEMGRQLNFKIEWTEEVGMANIFEGLSMGRYDAVCSIFAINPNRLRAATYTSPYMYLPYLMYSRADDTRFDNAFSKINDPSVKIAYLEGEMGQIVHDQDFPKASSLSLPNLTGFSDVPMQVATGKADICMGEPAEVEAFMAKNPGKIRQISGPPIRMQASAFQVALGEHDLRNLLDGTLFSLQTTGFIPRLLEKNLGKPGHYYFLPSTPWQ
jgi:ABC-type amino acid transport substrate-binding protein